MNNRDNDRLRSFMLEGMMVYTNNAWNAPRICSLCSKEYTFKHPNYEHYLCNEIERCTGCGSEYCEKCYRTRNIKINTGGMCHRNEIRCCILCKNAWTTNYDSYFLLQKAMEFLGYDYRRLIIHVREDLLKTRTIRVQNFIKDIFNKKIPLDVLRIIVGYVDNPYGLDIGIRTNEV